MSDPRFVVIGDELGLDPVVVQQAFKYSEALLRHPISLMQNYARLLVARAQKVSDLAVLDIEGVAVIKNVRQKLARLDIDGALTILEQAIKSRPDARRLKAFLNERAFIERRTHQNKVAAKTLKQVVALDPTDLDAWNDLGLALSAASRSKRSAQPAFESGIAEAKRRLEEAPGDIDLRLWLAEFHMLIGDMKPEYSALTHYRAALAELAPFDDAHLESNLEWNGALAHAHHDIGKCLVAREKLEAALESYAAAKAIVERASRNGQCLSVEGDLYTDLGECLGYLGQYSEAVALYERGMALKLARGAESGDIEKQIQAVRFHSTLADTFGKAEIFPEALTAYQKICTVMEQLADANPNYPQDEFAVPFWYELVGDTYRKMGNLAEALKSYKTGLSVAQRLRAISPDNDEFEYQERSLDRRMAELQSLQSQTPAKVLAH
jgi:tetratricopeptide (TPR) repeat protein